MVSIAGALVCGQCGSPNAIDRAFCRLCGAPTAATVSAERAEQKVPRTAYERLGLSNDWRAAPGALDPASLVAAEKRWVTVVKADLSGFTAMSELLGDPEEVTVIMNQVFAPLVEVVRRHGGYVDNYAGDMIICFWGAPQASEAGPEHAVRAALAMRSAVAQVNAAGISHGVELGISTGVATGQGLWAAVGGGASRRHTLSGQIGDYAALLEKYTDRGHVGLCPDTADAVSGSMELTPLPEHVVTPPGADRARPMVDVELLPGEPDWWTRSREVALRLIGRDAELDELLTEWRQARDGGARIVGLRGEAGIGKTRLALALADVVREDGGTVETAWAGPLSAAEGWPMTWPEVRDEPCLIILDGVDHAVDSSPQHLDQLAPRDRVLVLACARGGECLTGLGAAGLPYTELRLASLARSSAAALAAEVAGRPVTTEEAEWVWVHSEGNPRLTIAVSRLLAGNDATETELSPGRMPYELRCHATVKLDLLAPRARAAAAVLAVATTEPHLTVDAAVVGQVLAEPEWTWLVASLLEVGLLEQVAPDGQLRWRHWCFWASVVDRLVDSARAQIASCLSPAPLPD